MEEIGEETFAGCESLKLVNLPSTVKRVSPRAFGNCNQLEVVDLCESLDWGEMLKMLIDSGSPFLRIVSFNLPKLSRRVESLSVEQWKMDIMNEINSLPQDIWAIANRVGNIQSKLTYYELKDKTSLLELALWKAKIEETGESSGDGKKSCRVKCGADIVLPEVVPVGMDSKSLEVPRGTNYAAVRAGG